MNNTNLNQEAFERGLQEWANQLPRGSSENRSEAVQRILECRETKSYSLDLNGLDLTSLPTEIGSLTKLSSLYLNNNQLTSLPTEIGNLTELWDLQLNNNQLTSLPTEIGNLTELKTLQLNNNQLTSLPTEIGNLTELKTLQLNNNQLTSLPTEIGNLTELRTLQLNNNQLTSLPAAIGNLTKLSYLSLNNNQLTSLPAAIGNLTKLSYLSLNNNQLTSLPAAIGNLTELSFLSLNNNQLTSLPTAIGNLTKLSSLHLNSNQLTSLPAAIGNLTKLSSLHLNSNQLTSLPAAIGNLTKLSFLSLNNNQLTSLPTEIGSLTKLSSLYLNNNQLTSLPIEIGNLTELWDLYLNNNQLTTIPDSLFGNSSRRGRLNLFAEGNRIGYAEAERLNSLARHSNVVLQVSIYEDPVSVVPARNNTRSSISEQIIARTPEEQKEAVRALFQDQSLNGFHQFIFECTRTAGWEENHEAMLNALTSLTCDVANPAKEALRAKCKVIAETAFGTCGDRVGLAYTQMFFAKENENIAVADMDLQQLVNCARIGSVIKFLSEKAQEKIEQLKVHAGFLDPIETHLAYLQAAPRLGANLPVSGILYAGCSNVSDQDLNTAVVQFNSENLDSKIANHIYEDFELKKHPKINQLITEVGNYPEFGIDQLEGENSAEYEKRLKKLGVELKQEITTKITEIVTTCSSTNASVSEPTTSLEEVALVVNAQQNSVTPPITQPENPPSSTIRMLSGLSCTRASEVSDQTENNRNNGH